MQSLRAQIKTNTSLKKKLNKKPAKTSNNLKVIQIRQYKKTVRSKSLIKKGIQKYLKKIPKINNSMKQKKKKKVKILTVL